MTARTDAGPELHARLTAWLVSHARAFLFSLGKLYRAPLASLMTMAVIGIALALPAGLFVLLKNLEQVSGGWSDEARISVFLKRDTDAQVWQKLRQRIAQRPEVARVELITPDQALAEFRAHSGFGSALDALGENPLPAVLVVHPRADIEDPVAIGVLRDELARLPGVDDALLDMQWIQRLHALLATARRTVWVVAGMLGIAVVLVVGNTIRLDIQNRRQEIEVAKLIGATDAFIRRPFLYGGIWYGLFGGLLAVLMVQAALGLLAGPVARLASLYGSSFTLQGLSGGEALAMIGLGTALGWLGSWVAVGRHIREIEPS
ncbi:MAG: cell division protein FtsX [Gammaproteobacteria bacterium]|nr:MAG: cell division protein FtsX [Gammaproteobacteria bacterium]